MKKREVAIEVNSNFHHMAGEDLFSDKDEKFAEYRNKWDQWPKNFHVGDFPLFIDVEVTSALQTSAGRMVFAKLASGPQVRFDKRR